MDITHMRYTTLTTCDVDGFRLIAIFITTLPECFCAVICVIEEENISNTVPMDVRVHKTIFACQHEQ